MIGRLAIVALVLVAGAAHASAKDARCFTTDDGEYDCDFEATDDAGSFRISADGKPTFEVFIEDGQAYAGAVFAPGGRSVALPGTYSRSEDDPACCVSDATETQICAW